MFTVHILNTCDMLVLSRILPKISTSHRVKYSVLLTWNLTTRPVWLHVTLNCVGGSTSSAQRQHSLLSTVTYNPLSLSWWLSERHKQHHVQPEFKYISENVPKTKRQQELPKPPKLPRTHTPQNKKLQKTQKTNKRKKTKETPKNYRLYNSYFRLQPQTVIVYSYFLAYIHLSVGAKCSSVVRAFTHSAMGRRIDSSLSYFSFQPVLRDWFNKCRALCYPVCGMVHIKEPMLLIGKSSPCGGSGFPLSLSEWSFTICPKPYDRK